MTAKPKTFGLRAWIVVAAFFWLGSVAHAQFPIQTWDVHIQGGAVAGLGHLDFGVDGVVKGFVLLRPKTNTKMPNPPSVINFGYFPVLGGWDFEPSGRVVGFFSGGTEEVPLDVSFTATGNDNKINIHATSNDGPMSVRGKPVSNTPLPDLNGTSWTARVRKDGLLFTELFDLAQSPPVCVHFDMTDPNNPVCDLTVAADNLYDVIGGGPGYYIVGHFLRSWGRQIAFTSTELEIDKDTGEVAPDGNGRGATGTISPQERSSNMLAGDEEHTKVHMTIKQSP